jgi:hypothetical protein
MLPICQILPKNICLGRRSGQRNVSRGAFCFLRNAPLLKGPNMHGCCQIAKYKHL